MNFFRFFAWFLFSLYIYAIPLQVLAKSPDRVGEFTGVMLALEYFSDAKDMHKSSSFFWKTDISSLENKTLDCRIGVDGYNYTVTIRSANARYAYWLAVDTQRNIVGYRSYLSALGSFVFNEESNFKELSGSVFKKVPGFFNLRLHVINKKSNTDPMLANMETTEGSQKFYCSFNRN